MEILITKCEGVRWINHVIFTSKNLNLTGLCWSLAFHSADILSVDQFQTSETRMLASKKPVSSGIFFYTAVAVVFDLERFRSMGNHHCKQIASVLPWKYLWCSHTWYRTALPPPSSSCISSCRSRIGLWWLVSWLVPFGYWKILHS